MKYQVFVKRSDSDNSELKPVDKPVKNIPFAATVQLVLQLLCSEDVTELRVLAVK